MKFPTNRLPSWSLATWLFIISLFLHISLVLVLRHYKNPTLWENGGIAEYVFAGKGLSFDFSRPGEPTSWQAPGYPYLLAFFWHLFGFKTSAGYLCISLLQALAVASMIYPMSSLTERWFGPRAAKWAAIIVCLMPLYLWYPTRLHHTAFVMAMHPWLLWSWVCVADRGRVPHIVAAGVGTGLCALFQPVLLAIYGPLSCAFVLAAAFKKSWGQFSRFLAAGILTLIVLTPWTVRNWNVHGRLLLVKNSFGKELWMGNNPHATGTGYAVGGETEITNAYPPKS
ncbi:MAG: glycosyltransferase family 39 protein, partial [Bryobacteraceae bacterium]|nr:glycosyltransferase family 39 protein [Bryobacteraceae bacterium]